MILGELIKVVEPGRPFRSPSDTTAFSNGRFAVRDNLGIQLFSPDGDFLRHICPDQLDRVFGLANNDEYLCTVNTNRNKKHDSLTKPGENDVLFIDVDKNVIVRKIELEDIIPDKEKSMIRFIHLDKQRLFLCDLGLNKIFIINLKTVEAFSMGTAGKGRGQFIDPAGLATDAFGNFIVADAGNHQLHVSTNRIEASPALF